MTGKRVLGIVLAGAAGRRLAPLTAHRSQSAVPFGGVYRLVDFALSNLVNAGFRRICVLTQYKSLSLDRHLARAWRLSSLLDDYVMAVPAQQRRGPYWQAGSADAIYQSLNLIDRDRPDLVVVAGADHVYRMDPAQMIESAHRLGRGGHGGGTPGAKETGGRLWRGAARSRRPPHRGVLGKARRSARLPWPPGPGAGVDGHLRVHHQRAGGGADEGRGTTSTAGTASAGTSSPGWCANGPHMCMTSGRTRFPAPVRATEATGGTWGQSILTSPRTWTCAPPCPRSTSTTTAGRS